MTKVGDEDVGPGPSHYKIGNKVWIVHRYIAIRCTINEIDDYFAKTGGFYFYWVDEPIGHGMGLERLIDTATEAQEQLLSIWQSDLDFYSDYPEDTPSSEENAKLRRASLGEWRNQGVEFISGTHHQNGKECSCDFCKGNYNEGMPEGIPYMPPKEERTEWFNLGMIEA